MTVLPQLQLDEKVNLLRSAGGEQDIQTIICTIESRISGKSGRKDESALADESVWRRVLGGGVREYLQIKRAALLRRAVYLQESDEVGREMLIGTLQNLFKLDWLNVADDSAWIDAGIGDAQTLCGLSRELYADKARVSRAAFQTLLDGNIKNAPQAWICLHSMGENLRRAGYDDLSLDEPWRLLGIDGIEELDEMKARTGAVKDPKLVFRMVSASEPHSVQGAVRTLLTTYEQVNIVRDTGYRNKILIAERDLFGTMYHFGRNPHRPEDWADTGMVFGKAEGYEAYVRLMRRDTFMDEWKRLSDQRRNGSFGHLFATSRQSFEPEPVFA